MGAEEQIELELVHSQSPKVEREVSPEQNASVFAKLTWGWTWPLLWKGNSQPIQTEDMYKIQPELSMKLKYQQFERNLQQIQAGEYSTGEEVFKALYRTVQVRFWVSCMLLVASETVSVTSTLLAKAFLEYAESLYNNEPVSVVRGVCMALGIGLMTLAGSFLNNHFQYQIKRVVLIFSGVLNLAVYNKVATLSPDARLKFPTSNVVTLTSVSLGFLTSVVSDIHYIISFPIVLGLSMAILANNLRVAVLPGLAFIACGIAFNMLVVKYIKQLSIKGLGETSKRIGMVQQDLSSIKAIKLHNWEQMRLSAIKEVRKKEVSIFRDMKIKGYVFEIVVMLVPELAGVVSFATMVHVDPHVSAAQWFPSLTLFAILLPTVSSFSNAVATIGSGKAAYKKFTKFFNLENAKPYLIEDDKLDETAIKISDGSVTWTSDNQVDGIKNLNISIKKGELIFVVGKVGTGKTRLVSAMAGIGSGVGGEFKYSSLNIGATIDQWIAPTTIEENITFGQEPNEKRVQDVVSACELQRDVETLPNGLKTYVGKGGTTLSGGQRARVAMARTCYTSNDVVIFDDILSAVDTVVAKSIVDKCICGFLAGRTRIVTTHQLEYLHRADRILFIDSEHDVHLDTISALRESNTEFASFVSSVFEVEEEKEVADENQSALIESSSSVSTVEEERTEPQVDNTKESKLDGRVPLSLYKSYIIHGGGYIAALSCVVLIVLHSGCYAMAPVWLSFWSSDKFNLGVNSNVYISLYLAFILLWGLLLWAFNTAVISMGLNGSQKLSFDALDGVFKNAPFKFFDQTPTGRILTRFSDDLINLDLALPVYFGVVLRCLFLTLATMAPVFVYLPFSTLALIPLLVFFVGFSFFYKRSFREVQRCSSLFVAKSTGALVDSVTGIETIILSRNIEGALRNIQNAMDDTIAAKTTVNAYNGWLGVRLDFAGLFVALTVSLMCVFKTFKLTSSTVGLLLTMVPSVVSALTYLVQYISELEQNMNSVERLEEYAKLGSKDKREITAKLDKENRVTALDISESEIRFNNVSLSYGGPQILKNVSFTIQPHKRLGICGRSGAGKSSIIAVLLKAYEYEGEISIGDTSLKDIPAQELRNLISVIPQDPILLEGTVRKNIDPKGVRPDVDIWNLLKRCGLYDRHKFRLDEKVEDGGSNYSAGERQLLVLLRALALGRKVLVMDEATSSVDYEMQKLVQEILEREARDCTVVTVAHRIQTIIGYDQVLVLDNGCVVDIGTPRELYDEGGLFFELSTRAGIAPEMLM